MAVKIRFSRIGKKHAPVYRIVAIDSRKKRDGKCLENLGTYNPLTKEIVQFHDDRVDHWISVGAIVTDSVQRLIKIRKKQKPAVKKDIAKKEVKSTEKKVAAKKTTETKTTAKKATTKKTAEAKKTTKK
ncbi:MAG: 30S ribosomal protein S16 [Epsilonproteobacteria bacterium]|nr:30S ribosomal protein S16 [Campylobacterota bacterium]|tara:strand:- start:2296 stop:2682 length:387 start_codon:yes stop_codon:yes gene_type:complete